MVQKVTLNSESGVTLVELMVVTVIIAIFVTIAMLSGIGSNEQFARQNASRQLKEAFERARFDSVKRRADDDTLRPYASVEVRSDGFTLRTFRDHDNDPNTAPVAKDQIYPIANGIAIEHYASGTMPMTVKFNRRGEVVVGDPRFRVTEMQYDSSEVVIVAPTGTVNLVGAVGNNVNFNFNTPTLSGNPAPGEKINDDVIIP